MGTNRETSRTAPGRTLGDVRTYFVAAEVG